MDTTMDCICGTTHTFPAGVGFGTCAGCGLGLVLTEELTEEEGDVPDAPEDAVCDICDDEPGDIDSDEGYDPYTGGAEDMGYERDYGDDY